MATDLVPVVHVKDGEIVANSRDVAEFFDKRHDHVLRDADRIRHDIPAPKSGAWFRPIIDPHPVIPGARIRSFDLTRDGFTLLVMGYTGPKAMEFKVRYIDAFNAMEQELRNQKPQLPDFTDPAAAAEAWALQYREAQKVPALEAANGELTAKNEVLDEVVTT